MGKREEALTATAQAEATWRQLVAAHPVTPDFQSGLAAAYCGGGVVLQAVGRRGEALKAYGRAEAIYQKLAAAHPAVPEYQAWQAIAWYNLACVFAQDVARLSKDDRRPARTRTQETEKLVRESLWCLARARRLGYFNDAKKLAHFANDPDFAALRDRPDFKAFVASLPK